MILLLHIVIAISSLIHTALLYFLPSRAQFRVSYALVGLTIASGTALILTNSAHMIHACASGLVYLAIVFLGIALARGKFAREAKEHITN